MLETIKRDRAENVKIYTDNENICQKFYNGVINSQHDKSEIVSDPPKKRRIDYDGSPNITVVNSTSLIEALKFEKPMILNFASAIHPGGGYIRGANAQEECLCRSSTLYPVLKPFEHFYSFHKDSSDTRYSDIMIYSPEITFFRDDYGFMMDKPVDISVLTAAAPNNRNKHISNDDLRKIFEHRIRKVFLIAEHHRHKNLILGAWGCGAFACDPDIVAKAFSTVIFSSTWDFSNLVFAIADTVENKLVNTFRKHL